MVAVFGFFILNVYKIKAYAESEPCDSASVVPIHTRSEVSSDSDSASVASVNQPLTYSKVLFQPDVSVAAACHNFLNSLFFREGFLVVAVVILLNSLKWEEGTRYLSHQKKAIAMSAGMCRFR